MSFLLQRVQKENRLREHTYSPSLKPEPHATRSASYSLRVPGNEVTKGTTEFIQRFRLYGEGYA
jgi:hypothetical protein